MKPPANQGYGINKGPQHKLRFDSWPEPPSQHSRTNFGEAEQCDTLNGAHFLIPVFNLLSPGSNLIVTIRNSVRQSELQINCIASNCHQGALFLKRCLLCWGRSIKISLKKKTFHQYSLIVRCSLKGRSGLTKNALLIESIWLKSPVLLLLAADI